jgi:hypothetical protein
MHYTVSNTVSILKRLGDIVSKLVSWVCLAVKAMGYLLIVGKTYYPSNPLTTNKIKVEKWLDIREYTTTFQTGFANLGNGQPTKLFSSLNDQTVIFILNGCNSRELIVWSYKYLVGFLRKNPMIKIPEAISVKRQKLHLKKVFHGI